MVAGNLMLEINISNLIIIQIDIKKADKTKCFTRFFGADDEICAFGGAPRRTVGVHCSVCVIKCVLSDFARKLLTLVRTSTLKSHHNTN